MSKVQRYIQILREENTVNNALKLDYEVSKLYKLLISLIFYNNDYESDISEIKDYLRENGENIDDYTYEEIIDLIISNCDSRGEFD